MRLPSFSLRGDGHRPRLFYPRILLPIVALLLIAGALTYYVSGFAHAAPTDTLVPFNGTVPSVLAHSTLNGPTDQNQMLSMSISLRLRNAEVLKGYVQDISNRKSANFHRYLTANQLIGAFSPSQQTYKAAIAYVQASGFRITHTYKHRMLITFTGTVGQAEQVFHVTINNYTAPHGQKFYANTSDPLVPQSLLPAIQNISGLNNAVRFHHQQLQGKAIGSSVTTTLTSCPTTGSSYYLPSQLATAYNINGLYNAGYHGEGQSVALFELDTFQMSDITNYENCFGHSHTNIQTIVSQSPVNTDSGVAEVEIDAELVLSTAPSLGQLKIYEASNTVSGVNAEWAQIVSDATQVVSTSWGACESDLTSNDVTTENTAFTFAVAQGQSIFAATGDNGSSDCLNDGSVPQNTVLNVDDPASQPLVTAIGGTTLSVNGSNAYTGETTWNNTYGASGGGASQTWARPSWQNVPGAPNVDRQVPDVSLNADPNKSYLIYCTSPAAGCTSGQSGYPWFEFGGTSAAAPMYAGIMALINEQSIHTGGFVLGFLNPLLYTLANSSSYAADFHDVTTGNNDFRSLHSGKYAAATGYDLATGWGSINAANFATDIVALAKTATGPRLAPASMTWYFAEGSVGGGFQEYITLQNPDTTTSASVQITYLFPSSPFKTATHVVAPGTRFTVDANKDVGATVYGPHASMGAIVHVTSGPAIVAERPMYFNYQGISSGTDVIGATNPGRNYYFAEGDSRQGGSTNYLTFVSMLNPSSTTTANVTITYYTGSCGGSHPACLTETKAIGPLQRSTGSPANVGLHQQVAIGVSSDQNIVVERPMYAKDSIANAGGNTTGAASQVGATASGMDWLFAEGYTGSNFQEYFVMANFGATSATANVKLEYPDGTTQTVSATVPALGQVRVDVNAANAGHPSSSSAEVTSNNPIVVDRLMYFHFGPTHFSGISDVEGTPASHTVYAFAEGYTGNAFQEFLTLQNPTTNDETVAVTFFTPSTVFQQEVVVTKHSRKTLLINSIINSFAQGADSMTIQAMSGTIVVERPMYFGYTSSQGLTAQGGTDVLGYTGG